MGFCFTEPCTWYCDCGPTPEKMFLDTVVKYELPFRLKTFPEFCCSWVWHTAHTGVFAPCAVFWIQPLFSRGKKQQQALQHGRDCVGLMLWEWKAKCLTR